MLFGHFSNFGEMPIQVLSHFLLWVVFLLLLGFPLSLESTLPGLSSFHSTKSLVSRPPVTSHSVKSSDPFQFSILLSSQQLLRKGHFFLEMLSSLGFPDTIISLLFSATVAGSSSSSWSLNTKLPQSSAFRLFFFYRHFPGWLHSSSCSGQKSWHCRWPLFPSSTWLYHTYHVSRPVLQSPWSTAPLFVSWNFEVPY